MGLTVRQNVAGDWLVSDMGIESVGSERAIIVRWTGELSAKWSPQRWSIERPHGCLLEWILDSPIDATGPQFGQAVEHGGCVSTPRFTPRMSNWVEHYSKED